MNWKEFLKPNLKIIYLTIFMVLIMISSSILVVQIFFPLDLATLKERLINPSSLFFYLFITFFSYILVSGFVKKIGLFGIKITWKELNKKEVAFFTLLIFSSTLAISYIMGRLSFPKYLYFIPIALIIAFSGAIWIILSREYRRRRKK